MDLGPGLRLLVFDFDGTLLHLDVDWGRVGRLLGVDRTGETIGAAIQRLVLAGDPLLDEVTHAELEALGDQRVAAGVDAVLADLAERYTLAVFTRNSAAVVARAFADSPLAGRLLVVGREDTRLLKPDPEGLRLLLERTGTAPAQAVLVGDTYHDVAAARAAGVMSVVVDNERLAYRPEGADRYVATLGDLPSVLSSPAIWQPRPA